MHHRFCIFVIARVENALNGSLGAKSNKRRVSSGISEKTRARDYSLDLPMDDPPLTHQWRFMADYA